VVGCVDQLLRGERFVNRVTEVQLRRECSADTVGLFVRVEDVADDILNPILVTPVNRPGRNPGKEQFDGAFVIGFGLFESFLRYLNIEIPRVGEPQDRWQVNRMDFVGVLVDGRSRNLRRCR
jgi:hypothetical protein